MKRILFVFLLNIIVISGYAQAPYYYYNGERFPLMKNEEKICVLQLKGAEKLFSMSDISKEYTMASAEYDMRVVAIENMAKRENASRETLLKDITNKSTEQDFVVWPVYGSEQADELILSGMISVKLKKEEDTTILKRIAEKYKLKVVGSYEYLPLWYTLQTTMASGNPLEIANAMFEENLFASSYPEFLQTTETNCVSDTYFRSQWGLKNIQYSNIDISACDAWTLSTGKDINIAIIDLGIDVAHRDLLKNISSLSYDAMSSSSPSKIYTDNEGKTMHGTQCAGIAAAVTDNSLGIAGVAYNAKIMPISYDFNSSENTKLANGISWAWQHGADVVSCSWSVSTPVDAIKEAINMATTQGRNGFGCVVVVSSGNHKTNESTTVKFPATLSNVIAVGAISQSGSIANFSNYGSAIDVCAPGESVYTIVPNTNLAEFGSGTSLAAAHVSGLAALVLEVNPKLKSKEVQDIIETTTKKVGSLAYSSTKTNGTWNEKHGYGLIDAYSAVMKAKTYCPAVELKNQTITSEKTIIGCSVNVENVTMKQGGKLNFDASKVIITAPFSMETGTQITIK